MAAAGLRRMDGARNGEHFAPHVGRQPGRDERAGLQRRLDHQGALAEPRDDAVALREMSGQRRCAERVLADDGTMGCDAVGQLPVPRRVDPVQPGAHTGQGDALSVQRTGMGLPVDAQGETGNHAHTGFGQGPGEPPCMFGALRGGIAAAHHRQGGRLPERLDTALDEQHQGWVRGFQQGGRVAVVAQCHHVAVGGPRQPGFQAVAFRVPVGRRFAECCCPGLADAVGPCRPVSLPHRFCGAEGCEQLTRRRSADTRCQQQPQPGGPLGRTHPVVRD